MKRNVGIIDRVIRIMVALVIIGLSVANIISGTLAIVLIVLAGVFILTGFLRFCPLYLPFGINTWMKK
ncbi:MAG TPA: DUF2892 domain-containing protein [Paludibacter sp.]